MSSIINYLGLAGQISFTLLLPVDFLLLLVLHWPPCHKFVVLLDIGYLCLQPRAWKLVPRTTMVPDYGPLVGIYAGPDTREIHGRAGAPGRRGAGLAKDPLRGPIVPASKTHTCIWGFDGRGSRLTLHQHTNLMTNYLVLQ